MTDIDDRTALDRLAALLDRREWDAATLDAVADLLRGTGRPVRDPFDIPASYRVSFEDADGEHIDGEEACYRDLHAARAAFTDAVLSPLDGAATVALWTLGADDEWILVGSCNLMRLARYGD